MWAFPELRLGPSLPFDSTGLHQAYGEALHNLSPEARETRRQLLDVGHQAGDVSASQQTRDVYVDFKLNHRKVHSVLALHFSA